MKQLFTSHDRAVVHRNSKRQELLVQDLHQIRPTKIPEWVVERLRKPRLQLRSYWQVEVTERVKPDFFRDAALGD